MRDLIHYKKSFSANCFNSIINPKSEYYYLKNIVSWKKQRLSELQENNNLTFKDSLLRLYLIALRDLMLKTVELYTCINQDSASFKIDHYEQEVLEVLEHIGSFAISIRLNSIEGDYELAYKLKAYCVLMFDDCLETIKRDLCIDIYKSPLREHFLNSKNKLEQSAILKEVELISDTITKDKKPKTKKNLEDFIINIKNDDKSKFLADLRKTFKTEIGIKFRILIELLKDENVLLIGNREFKLFYTCITDYFNRNIGSYTSINDSYKHTDEHKEFRKDEIAEISQNLNPLIFKYKSY